MKENPTLEPTSIGAASIARRLLDPLSEYIKIGPHHLGVGMYQHDLSEGKLKNTLKQVVLECVSFVGRIFKYWQIKTFPCNNFGYLFFHKGLTLTLLLCTCSNM